MSTQIRFFVYENGNLFSLSQMTEPESAAISECVHDLLPSIFSMRDFWMEVETCLFDEDEDEDEDEDGEYKEPDYGLLKCRRHNPKPNNGSWGQSSIAGPIPDDILKLVNGKRFEVHPRQLGLNPWGDKVEIQFETLPSSAAPVKEGVVDQTFVNIMDTLNKAYKEEREDDDREIPEDAEIRLTQKGFEFLKMIGEMSIRERQEEERLRSSSSGIPASTLIQRALSVQAAQKQGSP
jgi:hypothetical protein